MKFKEIPIEDYDEEVIEKLTQIRAAIREVTHEMQVPLFRMYSFETAAGLKAFQKDTRQVFMGSVERLLDIVEMLDELDQVIARLRKIDRDHS